MIESKKVIKILGIKVFEAVISKDNSIEDIRDRLSSDPGFIESVSEATCEKVQAAIFKAVQKR